MAHDSRNPHTFVDGAGNVASGDQVMDNFDAVWGGLDSAIAGVAASLDAPVITVAAAARQVRDIGESNQIRAGRVLAAADFTNIGLAAPAGLWNLSNVNDSSGNARALTNKGTVTFGSGITGAATEAAIFTGSTAQALYIADTGAADPFRIRTGSWGCWFRTAKRGASQVLVSKWGSALATQAWILWALTSNVAAVNVGDGATQPSAVGVSDVCDDRWHFAVATYDGAKIRLYVDGALEASNTFTGLAGSFAAPLNIGAQTADGSTAATNPFYGRVDEAFVTADVLSPEQVLNLYCARITHPLGAIPKHTIVTVTRRKRGPALSGTDFPTLPVRLHNFVAGSGADSGTGGVTISPVGGGSIVSTAAPDGTRDGAQSFSGAHTGLGATDAGLPAALTARSYGVWVKSATPGTYNVLNWGTFTTADARLTTGATGTIIAASAGDQITGPIALDGLWHHVVVVEDNAAGDGVKRKLYVDGRNVGGSTVLNTITLAGANAFRVGAGSTGAAPFVGQISRAFVYAGALTPEQVHNLYSVGGQALAGSPKAEGDHIEALESSGVLAHFDGVEGCDIIDLSVVG
jgi:hypothetical protein